MKNTLKTSGLTLKASSLVLGLSLLLAAPSAVFATSNTAVAPQAQAKNKIVGTVVDENGEPLIGVTIQVKGAQGGTITDFDGNFALDAPANATLTLSYVGYVTMNVKASEASKIQMKPDAIGLDDVVVIGYGTVKKRDLTGAVSQVKSDDITLTPVPNPVEALQGKVAGLDITRSSGQAGATSTMQLRGNRSIEASGDPLVLIDGLPGDLNTLNANDIESIDVLKDAASTAVYGSAGANGVIIVTTKSGKEGKAKVNFNTYIGINGWSKTPKMYDSNSFVALKRQAYANGHNGEVMADKDILPTIYDKYLNAGGQEDLYGAYLQGYINTHSIDWADELLKTGITQNYSLSVSGGTEKTKAYMSLNFTGEDGQYDNDNYKVYSTNIKVDHKLGSWVTIGLNFQGSYTYKNTAFAKLENALISNPMGSLYDDAGNVNVFPVEGDVSNVSLLLNYHGNYRNNAQNTKLYLNPYVKFDLFKGFTWETRLNASLGFSKANKFNGIGSYNYYNSDKNADGTSTSVDVEATVNTANSYNYKWENVFTYKFMLEDKHDFVATFVTSWNHNQQETLYGYANSFSSNEYLWHNLGAGKNQYANTSYTMSKGMGFVWRLNYSYEGRYLASASLRNDGSSVLSEDYRWDLFPAVSAAWRLSDEKFMAGTKKWLDNLKLRIGWGVTGNSSIAPYTTINIPEATHFMLGNQTLNVYRFQQNIVDPYLSWEKSLNTNIGIDLALFNGRFDLSAEYYHTVTKDVLWSPKVPVTNGGYLSNTQYSTKTNICESENDGYEVTATLRPFVAKKEGDFAWTINGTYTNNKEKLTKFSADDGTTQYINGNIILKEGEPINSWYGYKLDGVWKTSEAADAACFGAAPGDLKINVPDIVRHQEGDYIYYTLVDASGTTQKYDANNPCTATDYRQVLGQKSPKWTMGLKNTFTFKGFDLSVYLYWRYGQMINYSMLGRFDPQVSRNFPAYFDYWTPETGNEDHVYPALTTEKPLNEYDGWDGLTYVDGSFFKIKNITLGYSLPKKILKAWGIDQLRVYGTITNPWVFAKSDLLKDYDPEMAGSLDYPLTKQLVFGVNVSF